MTSPRTRELWLLVIAALCVTAGLATTYIALQNIVAIGSLVYGLVFIALFAIAHIVVRRCVPLADPVLLPAVMMLCGLGVTMLYRLNNDVARQQTYWIILGVGLLCLLLALLPDHRVLEQYMFVIGTAGVAALIVTISPLGTSVNGSQLWIRAGQFQIQPGEFAKLAIVIFLAAYLRTNRELLQRGLSLKHLGPLVMFWGASMVLLVMMNDFGTSLLFYGTFLLMVYVATARLSFVLLGLAAFGAGAAAVYVSADHVRQRFIIWLDPWTDAQDSGYQLVQGLYALAHGGMFGRGLGRAFLVADDGSYVIPDVHTDFIFTAIGADLGWIGSMMTIMLFLTVSWRGFHIATRCTDGFSTLLAFGLAATFALQTAIIIGGVVRLVPLTGQTLPFVSYGGSSILANSLLIGLLLVISHNTARDQLKMSRQAQA